MGRQGTGFAAFVRLSFFDPSETRHKETISGWAAGRRAEKDLRRPAWSTWTGDFPWLFAGCGRWTGRLGTVDYRPELPPRARQLLSAESETRHHGPMWMRQIGT